MSPEAKRVDVTAFEVQGLLSYTLCASLWALQSQYLTTLNSITGRCIDGCRIPDPLFHEVSINYVDLLFVFGFQVSFYYPRTVHVFPTG